ncbi:hypothetical protein VNO80_23530 [Phaseolus coccineus]|uniref:Uncharacterized protein n=1 Tax=Phaseolus coccineus TaxID=3886 RepID=A0AAN9M5V0_PHACN
MPTSSSMPMGTHDCALAFNVKSAITFRRSLVPKPDPLQMINMPTREGQKHQNQSVKVLADRGLIMGNSKEHLVLHVAF